MSNTMKFAAVAAFLAATALPSLASAQSAYDTGRADYYAGAPGPNRPHRGIPGGAFGFQRAPLHVPAAPYDYDSGQAGAGGALMLYK
jgi:hypothetical protein